MLPDVALTLWQPWAYLVVRGYKPIENRTKNFVYKKFRGPLWIHAGKKPNEEAFRIQWDRARALCDLYLGKEFRLPLLENLSFGAIVGRVTVTDLVEPMWSLLGPRVPVAWHFPDQYGFVLKEMIALRTPVPCSGSRGIWRVPDSVLEQLKPTITSYAG